MEPKVGFDLMVLSVMLKYLPMARRHCVASPAAELAAETTGLGARRGVFRV